MDNTENIFNDLRFLDEEIKLDKYIMIPRDFFEEIFEESEELKKQKEKYNMRKKGIEKIKEALKNRLPELRKEKGMTQRDLSNKLNVSIVSISNYENGKKCPKADILYEMSKIFECNIRYLTDIEGEKNE